MADQFLWTNLGIDDREQIYLNKKAAFNMRLRLFKNNYIPLITSVNANFTEVTDAGYAAVSLVAANWTGSTTIGIATYTYPTITITFVGTGGGTETVYGAYLDDGAGSPRTQMAVKFATPYVIPAGGGSITIDLTDTQRQCP